MKRPYPRTPYHFETRRMETLFLQACKHFKVAPQQSLDSLIAFVLRDPARMNAWREYLVLVQKLPGVKESDAFPWLPVAVDPEIKNHLDAEAEQRRVPPEVGYSIREQVIQTQAA